VSPPVSDEDRANDRAGTMRSSDRTPVPDPTVLTTAALYREVATLQELIEQKIRSVENTALMRAEHFQDQIKLLLAEREEEFRNLRSVLEERIEAEHALTEEKLLGADLQFELVERGRIEQKKDTKDAVDAALTAQKEAVREQTTASALAIGKSEAATTKALEQLSQTVAVQVDGLRRQIDESKERVGDIERSLRVELAAIATQVSAGANRSAGAKEDRTGLYAALGAVAVLISIVVAVAAVLASGGTP